MMKNKKTVFIILGPTASGKTSVAIELAKLLDGEIISADSMQIYKGMDIGTAKPSKEKMQGITHHMVDVVEPDEPFSVAMFQQKAFCEIEQILKRGHVPIIAGGTGLYINALTYLLDFTKTEQDGTYRKMLEEKSNEELFELLKQKEEAATKRIHINDRKRLIRRLEILKDGQPGQYNFMQQNDAYEFRMVGLLAPREELYRRINQRVDEMFSAGLLEEATKVYQEYGKNVISMQAIGYKEFIPYFQQEHSLEKVREQIKQDTRRFAKRQMTWFRRDERIHWYDIMDYACPKELAEQIARQANG